MVRLEKINVKNVWDALRLSANEDQREFVAIGFVFVGELCRGKRISEKMIEVASEYAKTIGYETRYIMSGEIGFYEKYGFEKVGDRWNKKHRASYKTSLGCYKYELLRSRQ